MVRATIAAAMVLGLGLPAPAQNRQPPAASVPAPRLLEVVNASSIPVVLFPAQAAADAGLLDPPEEITLKPGQSAYLKVRADWNAAAGAISFLPESAVHDGTQAPYGLATYTPSRLRAEITDASFPKPERPGRRSKPADPNQPPPPLVPYPHPLITEILYAVPTGAAGDASQDGVRDTNGDEFIELVNPHDRPINLRGYTLSGKAPEAAPPGRKFTILKFTFPSCVLGPGEVAVVFNGHGSTWSGPVGDTARAPSGPNDRFAGARVFTMNVESSRLGLANQSDRVLLTSPRGEPIHCITWGDQKAPERTALVETAPAVTGQSVTRRTTSGPLEPHPPLDGRRFSPGRFPLDQLAEASKPAEAPSSKDARPSRARSPR